MHTPTLTVLFFVLIYIWVAFPPPFLVWRSERQNVDIRIELLLLSAQQFSFWMEKKKEEGNEKQPSDGFTWGGKKKKMEEIAGLTRSGKADTWCVWLRSENRDGNKEIIWKHISSYEVTSSCPLKWMGPEPGFLALLKPGTKGSPAHLHSWASSC